MKKKGGNAQAWQTQLNVSALAISSLWRVGTSFILQLWIAYQLSVTVLGQYTIVLAYLHVCQILSELGLPTFLVSRLAHSPAERPLYSRMALQIQLLSSLFVWGGLILLTIAFPFSPNVRLSLIYVGASLPFYAITSVYQTLFRASEQMLWIMIIEVLINTLILAFSSWIVWHGGTLVELVIVLVWTQAISGLMCWILWYRVSKKLSFQERTRFLCPARYTNPRYDMLRDARPFYGLALAEVLLSRLDILLLSIFAGDGITGIYSAAYNIVRVPAKLIQSYWQALYPTLSRLRAGDHPHYVRLIRQSMGIGFLLALAGVGVISLLAEPLLAIVYEKQIAEIVPIFRVLIWSMPVLLIEMGYLTLLMTEQKAGVALRIMVLHLCCLAILLPILTNSGGVGTAYAVLSATIIGAIAGIWRWAERR